MLDSFSRCISCKHSNGDEALAKVASADNIIGVCCRLCANETIINKFFAGFQEDFYCDDWESREVINNGD